MYFHKGLISGHNLGQDFGFSTKVMEYCQVNEIDVTSEWLHLDFKF